MGIGTVPVIVSSIGSSRGSFISSLRVAVTSQHMVVSMLNMVIILLQYYVATILILMMGRISIIVAISEVVAPPASS